MVVFIGSKGQLIKTAGVMREVDSYFYVSTEQHPRMLRLLESGLGVKAPDLKLRDSREDLQKPSEILVWFFRCLWRLWLNRAAFRGHRILLTQGDTLTTLLACIAAKLFGLKLAHVEAGLRSYHLFEPFPEEFIRRTVTKFAHWLFAPNNWAENNLSGERGEVIDTKQNTVYDVINGTRHDWAPVRHAIATIHRQETIYNKAKFTKAVEIILRIADRIPVQYILHRTSERQLRNYGLYPKLESHKNIALCGYYEYLTFMDMVADSEFVITDGGGLQEETYFLDVPCLILRDRTERIDGLGETACLAGLDWSKVARFLDKYKTYQRKQEFLRHYPSKIIADRLLLEGGY